MNPTPTDSARFKRQVVVRIGPDDWRLLEAAAAEHGSMQAAILAGLHALTAPAEDPEPPEAIDGAKPAEVIGPQAPTIDPDQELRAREAAQLLGLKTSTISGYIRAGKLPGRYDETPLRPNSVACRGWITTRRAVGEYRQRVAKPGRAAG